jgi:hypothetical protein
MAVEWSQENVLKLISLYEEKEVLWNVSLKNYHNREEREKALSTISAELDITPNKVKKKLETLRGQYYHETKKQEESRRSGNGSEQVYKSKWFAYEALHFIRPYTTAKTTKTNLVSLIFLYFD